MLGVAKSGGVTGSAFTGSTWAAPATIGGGTGVSSSLSFNGASQAVGLVREQGTSPNNPLGYTVWTGGAWSDIKALNADTTQGTPAITSVNGTAHAVFWGSDYHYYYEAWSGTAWTLAAAAVQPAGSANAPCGPSGPALAHLIGGPSLVFVNGTCGGATNNLYGTDLAAGVWGPTPDIASNPSSNASPSPSVTAPAGVGPELVAVYVDGSTNMFSAERTAGVWSTAKPITNGITSSPIALAPLATSGAWMAYVGTDGFLYTATFSGSTWSAPAAAFTPNVAVSWVAAAAGVGSAGAELVYLDANGAPFHTRLISGKWTTPVAITGLSALAQVSIASSP